MTLFVRHILPALIVLAGIVVFLVNPSTLQAEGAAGIVGAGMAVWLFGWLFRQSIEGDHERDVEDAAREYLDQHGRWPTDDETAHFERHGRWPETAGSR